MLNKLKKEIQDWLIYLTNNDVKSKDEVKFDCWFFVVLVLDVVFVGVPAVIYNCDRLDKLFWVIILSVWVWDNLRSNRE